jgi:hypothetical protein
VPFVSRNFIPVSIGQGANIGNPVASITPQDVFCYLQRSPVGENAEPSAFRPTCTLSLLHQVWIPPLSSSPGAHSIALTTGPESDNWLKARSLRKPSDCSQHYEREEHGICLQ